MVEARQHVVVLGDVMVVFALHGRLEMSCDESDVRLDQGDAAIVSQRPGCGVVITGTNATLIAVHVWLNPVLS